MVCQELSCSLSGRWLPTAVACGVVDYTLMLLLLLSVGRSVGFFLLLLSAASIPQLPVVVAIIAVVIVAAPVAGNIKNL